MNIVNSRIALSISTIVCFSLLSCDWLDDKSEMKLVFTRGSEIWLYDMKTEKLEKLVANHEIVYTDELDNNFHRQSSGDAKWSPNGKKIVFLETVMTHYEHLKTMKITSGKQQFFPNYIYRIDSGPEWSADGKQIVFSRPGFTSAIFIVNADGTNETQLTYRRDHTDVNPSLHPNNFDIIFKSLDDRNLVSTQLYHATVLGDSVSQLTTGTINYIQGPKFNPETGEIAYITKDSNTKKYTIWKTSNMEFNDPNKLLVSDLIIIDLSWSNDGELLVYVRYAGGSYGPRYNPEIWMMNGDGSDHRMIITNATEPSLWVNN